MLLPFIVLLAGLALLIWSADRFITGAAATAGFLGVPTILIGMVVIGFGTSAPELVVSAISALEGNPGLALGNAYGSNISNIALILGTTAVISPMLVHSDVLRRQLPLLAGVTAVAAYQLADGAISRIDGFVLLGGFALWLGWTIVQGLRQRKQGQSGEEPEEVEQAQSLGKAIFWLVVGMILLVISSRMLVWGAVEIARGFGVSDLIIGLTIVAIGTSLPELASAIAATRKQEHDLVLGNVLGSNLFNTLAVVGIAGSIEPMAVGAEVLYRDMLVTGGLTLSLFVLGYGFRGQGQINRVEGVLLLVVYAAYMGYLGIDAFLSAA